MKVLPAFVDETGVLSNSRSDQPVFGIGFLLVHDPARVTESFYRLHFDYRSVKAAERKQLRREVRQNGRPLSLDELDILMRSTRHHEFKFTDVGPHNVQKYVDLLRLYFSYDCFEFHSLLLDKKGTEFSQYQWGKDSWRAYVELGRELLEQRLHTSAFVIVDFQGQPSRSPVGVEDVFCEVEQVAGCIRASSETQVFLQMVDVLLGCVQADWKDLNGLYAPDSRRGKAKRDLVDFVRTNLGLLPAQTIVSEHQPIWESSTPSPFTVTLK